MPVNEPGAAFALLALAAVPSMPELLNLAERAALRGGRVVLAGRSGASAERKGAGDYVTDVDRASERAIREVLGAGADIVGMNCGRGPDRAIVIIREMRQVTDAPLIAYPNAGLPITTGGRTTYELGPEEMVKDYPALLDAGCNIVGGCCGSNPEHIRLIADVVRSRRAR